MRILVVTNMFPRPEAPYYGVFVREQVEALRAAGVEVDTHVIEGWRSPLAYVSAIRRIARTLKEENYDLIHAHHGYSGWTALRARDASGKRIPVVVTLHDGDLFAPPGVRVRLSHRVTRKWRLRAARRADFTITVHRNHLPPSERVACVPCGVDTSRFTPRDRAEARRHVAPDLPSGARLLFFPSDPARPEKRFDLASHAMEELRRRGFEARLAAGGRIAPEAMPDYYNAADAVLLLSDYEASPMVLKEALACERRVVSRRVGDAEWLLEGVDGARLCEAAPASIADAILEVVGAGKVSSGRARLEALELTLPQVTKRLIAVYERVLMRTN